MQSTYQVDLGHLNVIPGAWESQQRGNCRTNFPPGGGGVEFEGKLAGQAETRWEFPARSQEHLRGG